MGSSSELEHKIETLWLEASRKPNVFRYRLNVEKERLTDGIFKFLIQLNKDRTSLRRHPQKMTCLRPQFDPSSFNFTQIKNDEHLFDVEYKGGQHRISFIINNSPLTRNHCLVVPDLDRGYPQILNTTAIEYALSLLADLDNRRFRIGYNSPGALASVNHLHLHLVDVPNVLFSEHFDLKRIHQNWYRFEDAYPSLALVRITYIDMAFSQVAVEIMKIVEYFCDQSIPHNLFFTFGQDTEQRKCIRSIICPRVAGSLGHSKILSGFNVACFEMSGYVPVGSNEFYDDLCEEAILKRIESDMGKIDPTTTGLLVISDYCRTHHQVKPFSHMVMDLFQDAAIKASIKGIEKEPPIRNKQPVNENNDDTDSGRSSDHGSDQPPPQLPARGVSARLKKLEVHRLPTIKSVESSPTKRQEEKHLAENVLQVVRRKRRRATFRRNTIDVNRIDLDEAQRRLLLPGNRDVEFMNVSKSTNCIDKLLMEERKEFHRKIEEMTFQGGSSLPDLSTEKILGSEPKSRLTVVRPESVCELKIRKCVSTDDFRLQVNCVRGRPGLTGPDFITKSYVAPKQIDLTSPDERNIRTINVLLLNGHNILIRCNANNIVTENILKAIYQSEGYEENYFLGLCIIIGGDFVFLPTDMKIHKVAPPGWSTTVNTSKKLDISLSLFIRVKFYLPTLRGLNSLDSRHMLYLQLRKSVLEKHILCTADDLILLGGLALQAEVGDFQENMKYVEYFIVSHYLPEGIYLRNRELAKYLRNSHYVKRGLHALEAEHNFIRYVQELKEFGLHLYSANWAKEGGTSLDIFLAISISGICLFERDREINRQQQQEFYTQDSRQSFNRKLLVKFEWLEIENLCYSKHILCIVVRSRESLTAKDNSRTKYKLRLDERKSYFAFCLASDHHRFYMKLRNTFVSLKEISNEFNIALEAVNNIDHDSVSTIRVESDLLGNSTENTRKAPESRIKQLKMSMLNDNKLVKLRQKFLKRSKSVTELSSIELNENRMMNINEDNYKENVIPTTPEKTVNPAAFNNSYNRNKVKMGTRVFSSQQFLNRSYDNICDNVLNIDRMKSEGHNLSNSGFLELNSINFDPIDEIGSEDEEAMFVCKPPAGGPELVKTITRNQLDRAYVLHESVNSHQTERFSMVPEEETVSESLLEKFDNLSPTEVDDRVIRTISLLKDPVTMAETKEAPNHKSAFERIKKLSAARFSKRFLRLKKGKVLEQRESMEIEKKYTLGVSIVQGNDGCIYVKNVVPNGAGDRHGIQIGDQILSVNGKFLSKVQYVDAVKMLQSNEPVVELMVSQVTPRPVKNKLQKLPMNNSVDNVRSLELYSISNDKEHGEDDPILRYFANMKKEHVERPAKRITSNSSDCSPRTLSRTSLLASQSIPDLQKAKVVAIIPKRIGALPNDVNIGRRYTGPVRYPVTPGRNPSTVRESEVI